MERFYKLNRANAVGNDVVMLVDSGGWGKPCVISLDVLNSALQFNVDMKNFIDQTTLVIDSSTLKIKINDSFAERSSVIMVAYDKQNMMLNLPPNAEPVNTKLQLATDKNFLYVWVEESKRWKRLPLSEF